MGIYQKKVYEKDKNGKWKLVGESTEKIPHNENFWLNSKRDEKNSSLKEHTYLVFQGSEDKKNLDVALATTYFGSNEKVERKLLTKSNTIPKYLKKNNV